MAVSLEWDFSEEADFKCHLASRKCICKRLGGSWYSYQRTFIFGINFKTPNNSGSVLIAYCSTDGKGQAYQVEWGGLCLFCVGFTQGFLLP